jgi:hypothetical protein
MANKENEQRASESRKNASNRVNVRNGMKMVIEDRIAKANVSKQDEPLNDLLSYINFNYKNGFTVCLVLGAEITIRGESYSRQDEIICIKDNDESLFVIYRDRATKKWSLHFDELDLMHEDERSFHLMIDSILKEMAVEQYYF